MLGVRVEATPAPVLEGSGANVEAGLALDWELLVLPVPPSAAESASAAEEPVPTFAVVPV